MARCLILILCLIGLMPGCYSISHQDAMKMNADLRRRLELKETGIHFMGESRIKITPDIRGRLEVSGVRIQTVTGSYFTAIGSHEQIKRLVRSDLVLRLETAPAHHLKSTEEEIP
ncbi:hypothetical protein JW948_00050 [bacterium]|nr:hypothetical protein [bacterium]